MADIILSWLMFIGYIMMWIGLFKLNEYCFFIGLLMNTIASFGFMILYIHERDKKG